MASPPEFQGIQQTSGLLRALYAKKTGKVYTGAEAALPNLASYHTEIIPFDLAVFNFSGVTRHYKFPAKKPGYYLWAEFYGHGAGGGGSFGRTIWLNDGPEALALLFDGRIPFLDALLWGKTYDVVVGGAGGSGPDGPDGYGVQRGGWPDGGYGGYGTPPGDDAPDGPVIPGYGGGGSTYIYSPTTKVMLACIAGTGGATADAEEYGPSPGGSSLNGSYARIGTPAERGLSRNGAADLGPRIDRRKEVLYRADGLDPGVAWPVGFNANAGVGSTSPTPPSSTHAGKGGRGVPQTFTRGATVPVTYDLIWGGAHSRYGRVGETVDQINNSLDLLSASRSSGTPLVITVDGHPRVLLDSGEENGHQAGIWSVTVDASITCMPNGVWNSAEDGIGIGFPGEGVAPDLGWSALLTAFPPYAWSSAFNTPPNGDPINEDLNSVGLTSFLAMGIGHGNHTTLFSYVHARIELVSDYSTLVHAGAVSGGGGGGSPFGRGGNGGRGSPFHEPVIDQSYPTSTNFPDGRAYTYGWGGGADGKIDRWGYNNGGASASMPKYEARLGHLPRDGIDGGPVELTRERVYYTVPSAFSGQLTIALWWIGEVSGDQGWYVGTIGPPVTAF